jgi:hypothetical protein
MNALAVVYLLLNFVLCTAAGWLLVLGQPILWRLVLIVIQFGTLWNLAGLIWLGYDQIWPAEPLITAGFCLMLIGSLFFKQPLVTRRTGE